MKILKNNSQKGIIKIEVTEPEDLWTLERVVSKGNLVTSRTERKIKIGDGESGKVVRKPVVLQIKVEKVEYEPRLESLRILGVISQAPEEIGKGDHHSFNVTVGDWLEIQKEQWAGYEIKRIKEATEPKSRILVVAFERDSATIATLSTKGLEVKLELKGNSAKKQYNEGKSENFFKELSKQVKEYHEKSKSSQIIAASPGFWNEYLKKELEEEISKKTVWATCSDSSINSLNEIIRRPELHTVLEKDRSSREAEAIDELLAAIGKEKASYGKKETKEKITEGNIKVLLVSDEFLMKEKEEGSEEIEKLMQQADTLKAEIMILTTEEAKRLDNLGGVAGILRW